MHKLLNSFRHRPRGERVGDVPDSRPIRLTIVLRPGAPVHAEAHGAGRSLSHAEYAVRHGTPQHVLDQVVGLAREHGLRVVEASSGKHAVRLEGTYGQARAVFQPEELAL